MITNYNIVHTLCTHTRRAIFENTRRVKTSPGEISLGNIKLSIPPALIIWN